jgi:hypothetical protein
MALFFILACIFTGYADSASRNQFNGVWVGEITLDDEGRSIDIRIDISGNKVVQYFGDDEEGWEPTEPDEDYFMYNRNNLVYMWVNKGGVWSETQVYSLSFINEKTVNIVWLRHVNNYRIGGDNEDWHLTGEGQLTKQNIDEYAVNEQWTTGTLRFDDLRDDEERTAYMKHMSESTGKEFEEYLLSGELGKGLEWLQKKMESETDE